MLSRALARLRDESGISLLMSLLVLTVLTITTTGMITYTSAGSRTASLERSTVSARALAEAGLNNGLSILSQAVATSIDPTVNTATLLPAAAPGRRFTFAGGTADVWGTYTENADDGLWTINSTGTVANPTGGQPVTRTLTQTVTVHGMNPGGIPGDWNRMIHEDPSPNNCLVIEDVEIPVPVRSGGCITMLGTAKITGAATTVDAGSNVTMVGALTSSQRSASTAATAAVGSSPAWSNPTYALTSNSQRATVSLSASGSGAQSGNLDVRNFGFALPAEAVIVGIEVEVDRQANGSNVDDEDVRIMRGTSSSAPVGTDYASDTNWQASSDSTGVYGGGANLWGTTWTVADVNSQYFGVRLRADNDSGSSRTASVNHVRVRVYYLNTPASSIGLNGQNVASANVVGTCKFGGLPANDPCGAADRVYASTQTDALPPVVKPEVDLDYWYRNAKPGPAHPCNNPGGSFAGGFDNNYSAANPHPDNSRQQTYGSAEVTPQNSNYTCKVIENGKTVGEISWNRTTRVLTIKGTIYIDGDFRFDDDGTIVHYQGRGIIFASGKLEFDEVVCAGGSGNTSCLGPIVGGRATTLSDWDPTQNMMTVLSGGMGSGIGSEFDQGSTADPAPAYDKPGALQGLIYSEDDCMVHQWFHLSGPIICREIQLPKDAGWYLPQYYTWPDLNALTNGQKWSSVDEATSFELVPGPITG